MRRNAGAAEKREDFAQKRGSLPQNTAGMCRYPRCFFVAAPLRECQLGRYARTTARSADAIHTKELTRGFRPTDAAVHRATHAYHRRTSACGAAEKRRARHFAVSGCTIRRDSLLQLPYYCTFATEAQLLQWGFTRQAVNLIILSPLKPSILNQPFREIVRGLCCCLPRPACSAAVSTQRSTIVTSTNK